MTSTKENSPAIPKLIHVARIQNGSPIPTYLFLRKLNPQLYTWFEQGKNDAETETSVSASNAEEAMRLAYRHWQNHSFRMLNCGFRYNLPERDEHGINALFHQMVASYSSSNGIYFDEDQGNNCFINFASEEARKLWKKLKSKSSQ
jgi:hypothetical protein